MATRKNIGTASKRSRSQGWGYAKIDGERYESVFAMEVLEPRSPTRTAVIAGLKRARVVGAPESCAKLEGQAAQVLTVLGDHTFGKPDVLLTLDSGQELRISLKKPSTPGGQAHLQLLDRFREIWSKKYGPLPRAVHRWFELFSGAPAHGSLQSWSSIPESELSSIEIRHRKIYPSNIAAHHPTVWDAFVSWSGEHAEDLADYCLFEGAAASEADRAEFLYIARSHLLLSRDEVLGAVRHVAAQMSPSGRTLDLPWGYLQTHDPRGTGKPRHHPNHLQFHWRAERLETITDHLVGGG